MKGCDKLVDAGRRHFLRGGALATAGVAATTLFQGEAAAVPMPARVDYPSKRLANVSQLKPNAPMEISYPDKDSPGVLIKLGTRVPDGAGPDGDIVAFSTLCPHKGFPLNYTAADKTLNCPGHYSRFDCEQRRTANHWTSHAEPPAVHTPGRRQRRHFRGGRGRTHLRPAVKRALRED